MKNAFLTFIVLPVLTIFLGILIDLFFGTGQISYLLGFIPSAFLVGSSIKLSPMNSISYDEPLNSYEWEAIKAQEETYWAEKKNKSNKNKSKEKFLNENERYYLGSSDSVFRDYPVICRSWIDKYDRLIVCDRYIGKEENVLEKPLENVKFCKVCFN